MNSTLAMKDHVDAKLSSSASSAYVLTLLRQLKVHGPSQQQLHVVARSTTLASPLLVGLCGLY